MRRGIIGAMSDNHDALSILLAEINQQIRDEAARLLGTIDEDELSRIIDRLAELRIERRNVEARLGVVE